MFDDFDTQVQCEEFYIEAGIAGICEIDNENPCIGCGACDQSCFDDEEIGELDDAMEYQNV